MTLPQGVVGCSTVCDCGVLKKARGQQQKHEQSPSIQSNKSRLMLTLVSLYLVRFYEMSSSIQLDAICNFKL